MLEIGELVKTEDGVIGRIHSISDFNGMRYFRLKVAVRMSHGLHFTGGSRFVADSEIVAVARNAKATAEAIA